MPSHLDTLRRIHAAAVHRGPASDVDLDLAREAGMDGNYGHLLQSARDLDAAATEPAPNAPAYRLRCTFIPQAWINGYAVTVDPAGPATWETDWFGADLPTPNSDESDQLRDGADAPAWAKNWSGPYEVGYEVIRGPTATEPAPTTRHTPGPWVVDWQGPDHPIYAGETCVATAWAGDADANAARIVACVNALDGVDDPAYVLGSIAGFLEDVARGCDPDEARTIAADLLALLGAR